MTKKIKKINPDDVESIVIRAFRVHDFDQVEFRIRGISIGVPRRVLTVDELQFRQKLPEEEHKYMPPAFTMSTEDAQVLMDSLWDCGLRPVQGHGSAGQLSATEAHLEDMRAIAGDKLKVNLPKRRE